MQYIIILIYSLITFFSSTILAQELSTPELQKRLHNFINSIEMEKHELQGGAIAILHKGHVIYKNTFGYQKGKHYPITSHTLFPLASVSKAITATAIALMVEEGNLNLDQELPIPYIHHKVNLKNILSHTTGYRFSGNTQIEHGMERKQLLAQLQYETPVCKPGQCYFYSNATFSLTEEALNTHNFSLQTAIEKLRNKINKRKDIQLVPLQEDSMVAYPHVKIKNNVLKALPFPRYYPKAVPAAAGIFASIDGMIELFKVQFGYRPDLISKKTLRQFYSPYAINHDLYKWRRNWPCPKKHIDSYYGLGWRLLKARNYQNGVLIFHAGYIAGATSFVGFNPYLNIGIIILVNQSSSFAVQKGIDFWGRFLA